MTKQPCLEVTPDYRLNSALVDFPPAHLTIRWDENRIHFASHQPLWTLSSGIHGGGLGRRQHIVNFHVHKSYNCDTPKEDVRSRLKQMGINAADATTFMTSARLEDAGWALAKTTECQMLVCISAGFSNAARVPQATVSPYVPGTINIVTVVCGRLTDDAMVGSVITMTEAKAAALADLGVHTSTGQVATGTTTDAVVVCSTQTGDDLVEYAGLATKFGQTLGEAVYTALMAAGKRYFQYMEKFH